MVNRIISKKTGGLNQEERLELARLLIKAGYTVRLTRLKTSGKQSSTVIAIEYWEEVDEDEKTGRAV